MGFSTRNGSKVMDEWDEYVSITDETAVYPFAADPGFFPGKTLAIMYVGLGLSGEAGEVNDVIKKHHRLYAEEADWSNEQFQQKVMIEMGDMCWYLARICRELDIDLQDVLLMNVIKLRERKEKDELKVHD